MATRKVSIGLSYMTSEQKVMAAINTMDKLLSYMTMAWHEIYRCDPKQNERRIICWIVAWRQTIANYNEIRQILVDVEPSISGLDSETRQLYHDAMQKHQHLRYQPVIKVD